MWREILLMESSKRGPIASTNSLQTSSLETELKGVCTGEKERESAVNSGYSLFFFFFAKFFRYGDNLSCIIFFRFLALRILPFFSIYF